MIPKKCALCGKTKYRHVPGVGNPKAKLMLIGEAPGPQEDKLGKPFVGPAGQFLNKQLAAVGIDRKDVWITNVVKHRCIGPPDDKIIGKSLPLLKKEIKSIKPNLIVLLGDTAVKAVVDKNYSVSKDHGKIIKSGKFSYFVVHHPSAARRFKRIRKIFLSDFNKLATLSRALG
ncbi:MAG: uracil-DNA glycosylase [Candidatus Aenigmatarchaeota archaeon]|nr:uracil-DNA glycosylase [Candidatus Aenigmarchaeota archaeon]